MVLVCPILNRPTTGQQLMLRRDHWELVQCQETGFVFLANPPEYHQLESEFAWEKTYDTEKKRRQESEPTIHAASQVARKVKLTINPRRNRIANLAIREMAKSHSSTVRLLDIGCGDGRLMCELHQRFQQRGVTAIPCGIEVSDQLAQTASAHVEPLGGKIVKRNAIDGCQALQGEEFDLIMMSCFLEHEAQPLVLLQGLKPLLATHGAIVIKVPNYGSWNRMIRGSRWCGYRFPDHVNYFTPNTLRRVAQEAGFGHFGQAFSDRNPFNDNMYCILRK